jgi:hypothetical protein
MAEFTVTGLQGNQNVDAPVSDKKFELLKSIFLLLFLIITKKYKLALRDVIETNISITSVDFSSNLWLPRGDRPSHSSYKSGRGCQLFHMHL